MNVGSNAQSSCRIKKPRSSASLAQSRAAIRSSLTHGSRKVRSFLTQSRGFVMSRRSTSIKLATKAAILFGALFLVSVLIAAIPAHQQRALEVVIAPEQLPSQDASAQSLPSSQSADHGGAPGAAFQRTPTGHTHSNRTYKTITRPKTIPGVASPQ